MLGAAVLLPRASPVGGCAVGDREELKRRLRLWERAQMNDLILRVAGQQIKSALPLQSRARGYDEEEAKGKRAKKQTAVGSVSKAMQGLVGGVAEGSPEQKKLWTEALIPVSQATHAAHPNEAERTDAVGRAWGKGELRVARTEMKEVTRQRTGMAALPSVRLAPLSAPGPSGERQEHLDTICSFAGAGHRRRLFRAIDTLTIRWAIGNLPVSCRWLLNTQALFLRKGHEPACKQFSDED